MSDVEDAIRRAREAVERTMRAKQLAWGQTVEAAMLHCETQVAKPCSRCEELSALVGRLNARVRELEDKLANPVPVNRGGRPRKPGEPSPNALRIRRHRARKAASKAPGVERLVDAGMAERMARLRARKAEKAAVNQVGPGHTTVYATVAEDKQ